MIYLFYFFFCSLFISQSMMDISSALLLIASVYMISRQPDLKNDFFKNLKNSKDFLILIALWLIQLAVGYWLSPIPQNEAWKYISDIKYILMGFIFLTIWRDQVYIHFKTEKIMTLLIILISLAQIPLFFTDPDPEPRLGGFMKNPMTLAHGYGLWMIYLFDKLTRIEIKKNQETFLYITALAVGSVVILLTMTRGVWLALAVAFMVIAWMRSKKVFLGLILSGSTALGILLVVSQKFKARLFYSLSPENYDQIRWNLWKANWEIIKDHPLFGAGYGLNKELLVTYFEKLQIKDNIMISHSHNQIIHWTAGTGIIGLSLLLIFFFKIWKRAKNIQQHSQQTYALITAMLVYFFVGGLFEANFEHSKYKYMLMFALVLGFSFQKLNKKTNS